MNHTTPILFSCLWAVCLTFGTVAAQQTPDKPPAEEGEAPPKTEIPPATGSNEALALAEKVRAFAGGEEGWAQVDTLLLTFDYIDRVFWDRRVGKVRAETVRDKKEGDNWVPWKSAVYDIHNDEDVFKGGEGELTGLMAFQSAKGKWINHTFWLLIPLKVLDPGTVLSIDPPADGDDEGMARLRLAFGDVGITPQNQYVLHVDRETGRIDRWDFYRTADAEPIRWTFEKWTEVGPLKLALNHNPIGLGRPIHLADVHVNLEGPEGVWTDKGRVLNQIDKTRKIGAEPAAEPVGTQPDKGPTSRPTSRPTGNGK